MHLVPLDDALDEMRRYGAYLALWSAGAGREAAAGGAPRAASATATCTARSVSAKRPPR